MQVFTIAKININNIGIYNYTFLCVIAMYTTLFTYIICVICAAQLEYS